MSNSPGFLTNVRLLPPETIWLEPEQFEQARTLSADVTPEAAQWQAYLNALVLLGFEQWLRERLPDQTIERLPQPIESVSYLEVNGFKFCLMAVEHVLDEIVEIPQAVVAQPERAAHFYVLNEVSEEQEEVTVRGFLRFDEWVAYRDRHSARLHGDVYQLPLSLLDPEPNHLLFYCHSLQPAAIPLPVHLAASTAVPRFAPPTATTTQLTQWLQNAFDEGWQAIEQLMNPEASLSFSTRSHESGAGRGKLMNLGAQLGQQTVALLVNVTSEADGKVGVLVQLHPTGNAQYLMPDLKLSLRSPTGKTLQEVTSRSQDNYIQLKPFKGKPGSRFSIVIHLGSNRLEEHFEL